MKKILIAILSLLLLVSIVGCNKIPLTEEKGDLNQENAKDMPLVIYENTEYGFTFSLPNNWADYQILNQKWEGINPGEENEDKTRFTGPLIVLRHPQWTSEKERQDIPIMIFTLEQWALLQREEFHIGAAPIGPKELDRNTQFVFALPARYNYAFPAGYEEVDEILENNSLKAKEIIPVKPSELGFQHYWELARNFHELSAEFINAIYSLDHEKAKELVADESILEDFQLEKVKTIVRLQQQALIYDDERYNSIQQVGIEDYPYVYFHIFFAKFEEQWKIVDIQFDA